MNTIIIVVGFALGCTMDFPQIFFSDLSGILLGVVVTLVGGFFTIIANCLTGGSEVAFPVVRAQIWLLPQLWQQLIVSGNNGNCPNHRGRDLNSDLDCLGGAA
ncbi:2-keto-3-deoxygluconate permease [Bombilactobacillus apium]|uniref:2-keto-3-deoxygluconate permease n=1 Tax=Bombilactobacillus apium TaxID=2675299 RepID=UPI001E5A21CE|nr:2-keto-3-deoxygluconate permease [Bombilactobacillus apium]